MASPVDILRLLPDVAAIGRPQLQDYCNQWLERPIAREYGITHLIVGSDLMVTVNIDDKRAKVHEGYVFIPVDELAGFIIDSHFTEPTKRQGLHSQLRDLRDRWGDIGYRYEVLSGRVGRLWLKCKNPTCSVMLETVQEAVEGQAINMPPIEVTCPVCGVANFYEGSDLEIIVNS